MKVINDFEYDTGDRIIDDYSFEHNEPELCPICKKSIKPVFKYGYVNMPHNLYALYECRACHSAFLKSSELEQDGSSFIEGHANLSPYKLADKEFSQYINDISESFIYIYNQSYRAEQAKLKEIAGMGYRKSLEFLIKDYLCLKVSEEKDREQILKKDLSKCIRENIKNENVKICAERATWLGNDETHYVRKHTDKDVTDLKNLISVTVYWMEMEHITEEAKEIPKL